jgi:hypothetical protein
MRQSAHRAREAFLCLVILGLLVGEVVPWRQADLPLKASGRSSVPGTPVDPPGPDESALPIETVVTLFTDRVAAQPRTSPAPQAKTPQDAPWLKYMGFASTADGTSTWYVKDTKTGRMIRASQGQTMAGWAVVESTADRLILRNGDDLYSVNKR